MTPALIAGLITLAGIAQYYRAQRDLLGLALSDSHEWIDEIIEALKGESEERTDELIAQFEREDDAGED